MSQPKNPLCTTTAVASDAFLAKNHHQAGPNASNVSAPTRPRPARCVKSADQGTWFYLRRPDAFAAAAVSCLTTTRPSACARSRAHVASAARPSTPHRAQTTTSASAVQSDELVTARPVKCAAANRAMSPTQSRPPASLACRARSPTLSRTDAKNAQWAGSLRSAASAWPASRPASWKRLRAVRLRACTAWPGVGQTRTGPAASVASWMHLLATTIFPQAACARCARTHHTGWWMQHRQSVKAARQVEHPIGSGQLA